MAEPISEGVVFEIQVDRKLLESVLSENRNFRDSYRAEEANRKLQNEIKSLRKRLDDCEYQKCETLGENIDLKSKNDELSIYKRIFVERKRSENLEIVENHLTKMRLDGIMKEKDKIVEDFENERKILESVIDDNRRGSQQNEEIVSNLKNEIKFLENNLRQIGNKLKSSEEKCRKLERDNFELESSQSVLTEKFRILQEKSNSRDLESVESKILKIKLQNLEKEKTYLLDEFERERKLIERQNKPRVAKIEENLKLLRKWIEKEAKERYPRTPQEVIVLRERVQTLENEKKDLIEGFELERKVFRKILKKHNL